jgi:tetratricopeptide (TPR) repeat protein
MAGTWSPLQRTNTGRPSTRAQGALSIVERRGRVWLACALLLCFVNLPAATARTESREALQKAAVLVQQGRLEEADQQAKLALADPDTRAVACSILGVIRLQQNHLPESARFLREAIRLEPRLLGAHLSLAQVYALQGKPTAAVGLFRRVLELDPTNAAARIALARAQTEKGNYRPSLDLLQPVLAAVKQSPDGLLVLATDYVKTGDRVAAAAVAKDWTQLAGAPPDASIAFAVLLVEAGVVSDAIDILEHVKQAGPPSYELAFNLGGAYLLHRDPARALDAYDLALRLKPDSLPALRQAAETAEQQGQLERSLSYWMRAR